MVVAREVSASAAPSGSALTRVQTAVAGLGGCWELPPLCPLVPLGGGQGSRKTCQAWPWDRRDTAGRRYQAVDGVVACGYAAGDGGGGGDGAVYGID